MSTIQRKSLGEILVSKGVITEDQLRQAQEVQKSAPGDLGKIIVDLGFAPDYYVAMARAKEYGMQYFDFKKHKIDPEAVKLVPENVLKRHGVLPVMLTDNGKIIVAVSDPKASLGALDDIRGLLRSKNLTPQPVLAVKADIDDALSNYAKLGAGSSNGNGNGHANGNGTISNLRSGAQGAAANGGSAVPALIKDGDGASTPALILDGDSAAPALINSNGASPAGANGANGAGGAFSGGKHSLADTISGELINIAGSTDAEDEDFDDGTDEAPIIRIAHTIVQQAIRDRASDIHIEPEKKGVRIRYRVDGVLNEIMTVPKHIQSPLIARYKIIAEMNIAERRVPQDGRIPIRFEGKEYDLRVSSIPTAFGEKIVMRILDKGNVSLGIDQLGFAPSVAADILDLVSQPNGMFLVTGPTGSGKTTTLNSVLKQIATIEKNVCTVEDPVEYQIPGISQVQVNKKAGLNFSTALRAFLRQDPDIIMVGEMRDLETAQIAVEASLTGHLVLSTLHTNDSPSAIMRLSDMGVEPFLLSATVIGVMAQRLARRICPNCKEAYDTPASTLRRFGFQPESDDQTVTLYRGAGCEVCGGKGYKGRLGIYELFKIDEELSDLIVRRAPLADLKATAKASGMMELRDDGLRKALLGETTPEEVMRVVATANG